MNNFTQKFGITNSADIPSKSLKWAMGATAVLILSFWGWLSLGTTINTLLAIFVWWSFRQYLLHVGDRATAKWISIIMGVIAIYGVSTFLFKSLFSLDFIIQSAGGGILLVLFKGLFFILLASSLVILAGCIRVIAINKHHSFPLKRIAVSTAIALPLFIIVGSLGTLTFIGQIGDLMYSTIPEKTLYTDGVNVFHLFGDIGGGGDIMKDILGDVSGVFSFIFAPIIFFYKLIIVSPYLFLLHHFYRLDKAGASD